MAAPEPEAGAAAAQARVTQLEETLEAMAETLRHGVVILEDYKMENQESLWNKIGANQLRSAVDDIELPVELLAFVDAGKNPDVYTKEVLEACRSRNEQTNGKITAFEVLKSSLEKEVGAAWPEELATYQKHKSTAPAWTE